MSGSIDEYRFENVTADTYYAICDVRRNIKRFVEDSHTIDLNCNPVDGQREHKELNEVVTKNIIDAIKDRLYNIDTENKFIQGVDVEAVRCVVGNILADYYYDKGREVAQDVATKIAYSGKDIKDISVQGFYEMTEDIRKDVMAMDDNINDLYGDIEVGHAIGYCGDPCVKLSEWFVKQ